MKYFIDTEFLEGTQKILFGKLKPTIDLISIGIVDENNREFYAISKEFNLKEAWNRHDVKTMTNLRGDSDTNKMKVYWIRENVLYPIFWHLYQKYYPAKSEELYGNLGNFIGWKERKGTGMKEFKKLLDVYGKTNKEIAEEVFQFCTNDSLPIKTSEYYNAQHENIEFYGYYCDYDWVVFCWLFGRMIDLPKGFPMYCIDLKQTLDEKAIKYVADNLKGPIVSSNYCPDYCLEKVKELSSYPKQTNEHDALADAKWNKQLYEFLNTLK